MASTCAFSSTFARKSVRASRTTMVCKAAKAEQQFSGKAAGLLAAGLLMASPAFAVDAEVLQEGKGVFNGNCAACHLGGNNSVLADKTLRKDAISKYLDGGYDLAAIKTQVINGKGAMPAWADRLDADEIDAVSEYVYYMADKWQ